MVDVDADAALTGFFLEAFQSRPIFFSLMIFFTFFVIFQLSSKKFDFVKKIFQKEGICFTIMGEILDIYLFFLHLFNFNVILPT
jgi:hypothetical protein